MHSCSFSSGNAFLDSRFPYVYASSDLSGKSTLSVLGCEHISTHLTRSKVLVPASPPPSECQSVTPRSQTFPDTPPVLDADIFDSVPFSVYIYRRGVFELGHNLILSSLQASFSAFLNFSTHDATLQSATITADTAPVPVKDVKRLSSRAEASYYVEVYDFCSGRTEC